ncbi:MAG: hypothetical protein Kow0031_14410 [Anaerolineae bacterium]
MTLTREKVGMELARQAASGQITERDDALLEYLSGLEALTLDQARRLLWPETSPVVVYQRLGRLARHHLLQRVEAPPELQRWGLTAGPVYEMGPGGQLWRQPRATLNWGQRLTLAQRGRRLLAAEVVTRLLAAVRWRADLLQLSWISPAELRASTPRGVRKIPPADGLTRFAGGSFTPPAILWHLGALSVNVAATPRWAEIIKEYDYLPREKWQQHRAFAGLATFPLVAIIAPDVPQRAALLELFQAKQRGRFITCLATWPDILAASNLLTAPIWTTWRRGNLAQGQSLAAIGDE